MPKYLCDYCDVHLNFDSQSGRKQHNRGRKHQENVRGYYAQYAAALAQANREAAASGMAPVTHGITLMPPSQTAGVALRPVAQPFAPYPQRDAGPPAGAPSGPGGFAVRTLGPPMNHGGPPRPPFAGGPGGPPGGPGGYAPPSQFQGALGMGPPGGYRGPPPPFQQQQQQQQPQGGPRGPMPPPPPFAQSNMPRPPPQAQFGGASYAPPNQPPPQQQQQQSSAPPSSGAAPAGAAKTFVNPDRMRALGLQDHR